MEQAMPTTTQVRHPIRLVVTDDLQRNRLTAFFRLILAIPAFIVSGILGYLNRVLALFSWFLAVFMGRLPEGLRNFAAFAVRYEQQTAAYALLLTDRYPSFNVAVSE